MRTVAILLCAAMLDPQQTEIPLRVRLVPALPGHPVAGQTPEADEFYRRWAGTEVRLGKPITPCLGGNFSCGSDVMWPILEPAELIAECRTIFEMDATHRVYCCRHQIEAGD